MKPYSHYCSTSRKTASTFEDIFIGEDIGALDQQDLNHSLQGAGIGAGLGAGGGLISALLLESLKDPNEAQYLRRALQGAGIGALAGGGLGGALGLRLGNIRSPDNRFNYVGPGSLFAKE